QQLINLPSRASAEPINQAARAELMHQVTTRGFITDYQGVRISRTGKRFAIRNAIVWNLTDSSGVYQGQAACFSDWTDL
ncbi:MAG: MEKHLA domain-containing protein, partial [Methylococcales bacterium]|nr:MEKHLA domain-containing protein [Methylococcales bacterium]